MYLNSGTLINETYNDRELAFSRKLFLLNGQTLQGITVQTACTLLLIARSSFQGFTPHLKPFVGRFGPLRIFRPLRSTPFNLYGYHPSTLVSGVKLQIADQIWICTLTNNAILVFHLNGPLDCCTLKTCVCFSTLK